MTVEDSHSRYLPEGLSQPAPRVDKLDAPYWSATREHRVVVQQCGDCRTFQWGPEWICHSCYSYSLLWTQIEARGTIYSWERVWHPVTPALAGHTPYVVVLVDLTAAPGVRMVGNLVGDPEAEVSIGAPVEAVFEDHEGFTLVQWAVTEPVTPVPGGRAPAGT